MRLREALRSLEIAGIVKLQKGVKGGAFIQSGDASRMNEVVRDMLSLGSISVAELTESRVHIQDLVVRLACERATKADLDALEANIDHTEEVTAAGRYLDRVECSREFYRLLVAAAHNQVLAMMVRADHRDPDAVRLHARRRRRQAAAAPGRETPRLFSRLCVSAMQRRRRG